MRLARERLTPERIVTPQSVENALRVLMAIGGSTNAVLHLTAIAGRMFLNEQISAARWIGVVLIMAGVVMVGRTAHNTTNEAGR